MDGAPGSPSATSIRSPSSRHPLPSPAATSLSTPLPPSCFQESHSHGARRPRRCRLRHLRGAPAAPPPRPRCQHPHGVHLPRATPQPRDHPDMHDDLHQASPPTTTRLHRTQATIVLRHDHHDVCTATVPDHQPVAEVASLPSDGTPVSNILAKAPVFPFPIVALA